LDEVLGHWMRRKSKTVRIMLRVVISVRRSITVRERQKHHVLNILVRTQRKSLRPQLLQIFLSKRKSQQGENLQLLLKIGFRKVKFPMQ